MKKLPEGAATDEVVKVINTLIEFHNQDLDALMSCILAEQEASGETDCTCGVNEACSSCADSLPEECEFCGVDPCTGECMQDRDEATVKECANEQVLEAVKVRLRIELSL